MRFLSVADRELRSTARRKSTYRTRWITALVFFGLLVWLLWAFNGFANKRAAIEIFRVYSVLAFLYCLFIGVAATADCISVERREGTLGLLFLTNMNSAEIIAGKLCSTALASAYGLVAIFPMLALPLLMGGITLAYFAQTVLALLNAILFALAAGFLASVVCRRQFTAIAVGMGLMIIIAGGFMILAAAASLYGPTRALANGLAVFSPLYTVIAAEGGRVFGVNRFWHSAILVAGISLVWLALTTLLLAYTWRDRPKNISAWNRLKFWRGAAPKGRALRKRLLAINPIFWLASPQRVSSPVFMAIAVLLTIIAVYIAAPFFGRVMRAGAASPVFGYLFAWLWTGLAIHALVLYYAAMSASQRLAEDKQMGALELILSTPITERTISRGLWLAYGRRMLFPGLLAVLIHLFFIWMCLVLASLDPPGQLSPGASPAEIFWGALLKQPVRGQNLDWEYGFALRVGLLTLLQLIVTWPTLGWVARWLGVRMKHPGFAPVTSLALLCAPPVLLFTFTCYLAEKFNLDRMPERQIVPMMMWLGLTIGLGYCALLSVWAAERLRNHLRSVALSRYQPLPRWQFRLPSRRFVRRLAVVAAAIAAVLTTVVLGYYAYQNWHSKRAWGAFQASLKKSGVSLELRPLMPEPVPDRENFARSAAFQHFAGRTNSAATSLFDRLRPFDLQLQQSFYQGNSTLTEWSRQLPSPLQPFVKLTKQKPGTTARTKRQQEATAVLQGLEPHNEALRELTAATLRFTAFQISTNRDASAVFYNDSKQAVLMERLHLLFQVRACAWLALGQNARAAEDVLTGLRLARLTRQLPDARSALRLQVLLVRSLQPLWEGLGQDAWTAPQLAAFQRELGRFNLLSDYTNAIRRVVLGHIEVWRAIPSGTEPNAALASWDGGYMIWELQPRAWWFDNCIQIYEAGRNSIHQVDVAGGLVRSGLNWSALSGLPVEAASRELLLQSLWPTANPASVPFAQTAVNEAILACAIERFRSANKVYPETLDKLVPEFLDRVPRDTVSGRPIIYQRLGDGSFILRGVGPNGKDDRNSQSPDDWLWTYSTNTPSATTTK